ncbi:hypothetical protein Snov_0019 [Ancylobacter novellus DSM 506]|uniref:Uncharacterized protein n=1 Tax=Ancylobacter novellus (strain ATCC 8093 / DSM 506 / JCM 20403 / CCM 1077 / IAM 12100 / NBRC 12443 / NCIMB 10456) TaxID=639283 RepID=D6ZZU2_ANCN5|nr:hypothetical protein [Ancylobacter novellus]ADH87356.1 hypothetical protein Snov_0019 [Ancylobacter novellus DSM 506]
MPWVRFIADFDFKPKPAITIAYRAGFVGLVSRSCAAKAKARGLAIPVSRPGSRRNDEVAADGKV